MKKLIAPALVFVANLALAANPSVIPDKPVAVKQELLFSDDFEGTTPAPAWHKVVPTFVVEEGHLKGTQTRVKNEPSPNGKSVIRAHAAVHGLEIPTKDSIVEVKFRLDGATMMDVEYTDRKYTGSHYGHICRAQVRPDGVTLIDERDGNMRSDLYEMKKDPARKKEVNKLLQGRSARFPAKIETGKWHDLVVEVAGDEMRVTIDGQPAGYLKSSGIAHATKSKLEFGVAGQDGSFDDLKVWNAAPAQ